MPLKKFKSNKISGKEKNGANRNVVLGKVDEKSVNGGHMRRRIDNKRMETERMHMRRIGLTQL